MEMIVIYACDIGSTLRGNSEWALAAAERFARGLCTTIARNLREMAADYADCTDFVLKHFVLPPNPCNPRNPWPFPSLMCKAPDTACFDKVRRPMLQRL
jgi:hypothetical protein